jgi:hypothetical protein
MMMMNSSQLFRVLGLVSCLSLASCAALFSGDDDDEDRTGYNLDRHPNSGQSRYLPGREGQVGVPPTGTISENNTLVSPDTTDSSPAVTDTVMPPTETVTPPPTPVVPPPPVSNSPGYGKPVPGRVGFVYPPGVDSKPENMVDVRDFTPGQKVRDPRTGKIFLVP